MSDSPLPRPDTSLSSSRHKRHIPLALALVGGITLLILLSVGSVMFISLRGATENTFSLLADKANANLDLLESQLGSRLEPVAAAGSELSALISEGRYDADESRDALREILRGALAALPNGTAAIFIRGDGTAMRIARINNGIREIGDSPLLLARQRLGLRRALTMDSPSWVEPTWLPLLREPILSFIAPVTREEVFLGAVIISIRLGELANYMAQIEAGTGVRAFVLYDNKFVLAHRDLLTEREEINTVQGEVALPTIAEFKEESFRLLNSVSERAQVLLDQANIDDAPLDDEYILLIRNVENYGPAPWQIGLRFFQRDISTELDRLKAAGMAGFAILLVTVLIGYLFARNLTRKITVFGATARRLRELDITEVPKLPDSRIREFAYAADSFNAMVAAMRWFETYVPKTLVLRLMHMGASSILSEERVMTVLFSDIRGFSTLVEHMDPAATADLLNRHFELLSNCIEAEDGTVDKFMGDSVMAFWGAPEEQPDHAARALRATAAMQEAVLAENSRQRESGEPVVSIRVGVHSGPVTVGNIGSHSRVNYTVIGDTVNVAARLEGFAKDLAIDDDCVALVSGETVRAAGDPLSLEIATEHLGEVPVRGREGRIDVYRLR